MLINAHHPFKGRHFPGEVIVLCALVPPVSALLRARRRVGSRTWCGGGCQLHLALGAGIRTRAEQTLPTASEADEQELSDRRNLYQRKRPGQVSVSSAGFHRADD